MVAGLLTIIRTAEVELVLKRTPSVAITCVCLRLVLMRTPYVAIVKTISQLFRYDRIISQPSTKQLESSREGSILPAARCGENSASVPTRAQKSHHPPF